MNDLFTTLHQYVTALSNHSSQSITYTTLDLFANKSGAYEILIIIFGTIGSVIISFSYLPQLIQTMRTKGTTGLSFYMWLLVVIAEAGFVIWGILYVVQGCQAKSFEQLQSLGYITSNAPKGLENNIPTQAYINNHPEIQHLIQHAHQIAIHAGLINGLALFVCDVPALIIAFMLLWYKSKNIVDAKKHNMSEAEWCDKLFSEVQAKKAQKQVVAKVTK